jgi:hypothetical protein
MESQIDRIIHTNEPTISVPTDIQPNIPSEYWSSATEWILAIAVLIRSIALLIRVLTPLMLRKKSASAKK